MALDDASETADVRSNAARVAQALDAVRTVVAATLPEDAGKRRQPWHVAACAVMTIELVDPHMRQAVADARARGGTW